MGIIDGSPGGMDVEGESEAIVVSFLLGFVATRIRLLQPVIFTYDPPEEQGAQEKVTGQGFPAAKKMTQALKASGYDARDVDGIKAVLAPSHAIKALDGNEKNQGKFYSENLSLAQWQQLLPQIGEGLGGSEHYAITGGWGSRANSDMSQDVVGGTYLGRNRRISDPQVLNEAKQAIMGMAWNEENGAYYGIVDDPDTQQGGFVASSVRRIIPYNGEGGRWNAQKDYQGLIGGAGGVNFEPQHGSFEPQKLIKNWNGKSGVVGYCHGMTWAIQRAKEIGPWATPYELGVGIKTKKLASCMGCTSFMYATGFPPSAMHIGSAQSWVPLPPKGPDNPQGNPAVIEALNHMWATDMAGYLLLGSRILREAPIKIAKYRWFGGRLHRRVKALVNGGHYLKAANIYLDASTLHNRNDTARVNTVLD